MLTAGAAALGPRWVPASAASPMLTVDTRTIEVNKKAAKVFGIVGPGGRSGLVAREGEHFAGSLLNSSGEHLQMHWHGQIKAAADQDRAAAGPRVHAPSPAPPRAA